MKFSELKTRLLVWAVVFLLLFLPGRSCLAQDQVQGEASFLGALLTFSIVLVLGGGIFFTLKIHSLLKGGELSSAWVFSGVALAILLLSAFLEFLNSLGVIAGLSPLVFLFQLLGFFLLVLGIILLKKKLS